MKRYLAIVSVSLLLSLTATVFWVQHVRWRRMEAEFRRDLVRLATLNDSTGFLINTTSPSLSLEGWSASQLKAALEEVHLCRASPHDDTDATPFRFEAFDGQAGSYCGIQLAYNSNDNTIGGDGCAPAFNAKWSGFVLTPESCHALKRRVQKKNIDQLRALHVPLSP